MKARRSTAWLLVCMGLAAFFVGPGPATAAPVLPYFLVSAAYGRTVLATGFNFPLNTRWKLTSDIAIFTPDILPGVGSTGAISVKLSIPADTTATTFLITATELSGTYEPVVRTYSIEQPTIYSYAQYPSQYGDPPLQGINFVPAEQVSVSYSGSGTGPSTVTTDAYGSFTLLIDRPPPASRPTTLIITATGSRGHQVVYSLPSIRTTLTAGEHLDTSSGHEAAADDRLGSSDQQYYLRLYSCGLALVRVDGPTSATTLWRQDPIAPQVSACSLSMRTDGDLVLMGDGNVLWSSGTRGSGTNNRVVLSQDGNLVIYTDSDVAVWSTRANGLLFNTTAYSAATRIGSAVYINALVKNDNLASGLVRAAGRIVYIQRYINGTWQNMLTRTTNATGQFAVGFIQAAHVQYRIFVPATANGSQAVSASTQLT